MASHFFQCLYPAHVQFSSYNFLLISKTLIWHPIHSWLISCVLTLLYSVKKNSERLTYSRVVVKEADRDIYIYIHQDQVCPNTVTLQRDVG
jgi:hypothetical protein